VISNLTYNFFTGVTVNTGDILMGGGLVGLNNNSRSKDSDTYVELGTAYGNIFGDGRDHNIIITADFSLRGGGVIGLNGLSNAKADIISLTENVFAGIDVEAGTYLRGGGVVGIQINDDGNKDPNPPASDTDISAFLARAANNLFYNINVKSGALAIDLYPSVFTTSANIEGGGIIGVRSNRGTAGITYLEDNDFQGLNITADTFTYNGAYVAGSLFGGGVAGVSSHQTAIIDEVNRNDFDEVVVEVDGDIRGGGLIGVDAANTDGMLANRGAYIGTLSGNTFNNSLALNTVTSAGTITGGGIVGGYAAKGPAAAKKFELNSFSALKIDAATITGGGIIGFHSADGNAYIENVNLNFTLGNTISAGSITGGGLIGLAASGATGNAYVESLSNNLFRGDEIHTGEILGGGAIGLYSDEGSAEIETVRGNAFQVYVRDDTAEISGGGLIGVHIASGSSGIAAIENITENEFIGSVINAKSISGGGVIGVDAVGSGGSAFIESLDNNNFINLTVTTAASENITGGGVIGVKTLDENAYIKGITGENIFSGNTVRAGGHIDGGGIIGVTGTDLDNVRAGIGLIDNSLFASNTITAQAGRIMGGLVYSYGLSENMTINNSLFVSNIFTSTNSSGDGGAKVYGAVTVDTGTKNPGGPHTLTLSASNGSSTLFWDNKIYEPSININPRYNSLYFGTVLPANYTSGDPLDDPDADAALVIDAKAGSFVVLNDPIIVDQRASGTPYHTFSMDVEGSGGRFGWGGYNDFRIDTSLTPGSVTLKSGSDTTLLGGYGVENNNAYDTDHETFSLYAPNFDFSLNPGGTLTVMGSNQMTLNSASLNGNLYFNLDGTVWQNTSTPATPTNPLLDINATGGASIDGATVRLLNFGKVGDPSLRPGSYFPLIATANNNDLTGDPANNTAYARQGSTRAYNFIIDKNGPDGLGFTGTDQYLFAYVRNQVAPYEARVLTESRAASLGFLRAAWLPDHSYQQADLALYQEGSYKSWVPFAGIDGAWAKVDTRAGGEYELSTINGLLGIAREDKKPGQSLLTGLFIEAGYGDYDTYNTVWSNQGYINIRGGGTLRFAGGGVMFRREWSNGVRLEGSFRAGEIKNEFSSAEYIDPDTGLSAAYDVSVPYYAAHLGLARAWMLNDHRRFDLIGRYFWARQGSVSAVLPNGEVVDFDSDDSHRVRVGGRMTFIRDERREWYLGASGEYEFAGNTAGSASGYAFDSPDMGGFTGIGEIGWIWRSTKDDDFSFETGLQGYVGRMRGISGGIRMEWRF
jgi:hypothetical protein